MKIFLAIITLFLGVSMANAKPKITILATGGTIAGSAKSDTLTTNYQAGVLGIDTLINAVPEIKNLAEISGEQLANIDSKDMSDEILLRLATRVKEALKSADGVVITHGTDTMEESAYFLSLVVKSDKAVVLVGAMRPATAISADGPKNLYNAVALATDKRAKGVFVAMNDKIFAPRAVQKTHTLNLNAFEFGEIGTIIDGKAKFYSTSSTKSNLHFDISKLKTLPKVAILYSHANDESAVAANALFESGVKALIIAGSGAGSIHETHKNALKNLLKKGAKIVVSSRVKQGFVALSEDDKNLGFISAGDLNPQKARILLQLALTKTSENKEIQGFFEKD